MLALGMVLGHNILPHEHQVVSHADQCIEDLKPSWVSWLSHLFHPDLGSHHLEDFAEAGRLTLQAFVAPDVALWSPVEVWIDDLSAPVLVSVEVSRFAPQSVSLRAPPVVS